MDVGGPDDLTAFRERMLEEISLARQNPELSDDDSQMFERMEAELNRDPRAFMKQVEQQQNRARMEAREFLNQICSLDPEDEEVGFVVREVREKGEEAFAKYMGDQELLTKLSQRIALQVVVSQVRDLDETSELGFLVKELRENGEKAMEKYLQDEQVIEELARVSLMSDPNALHAACRSNDLDLIAYLLDEGKNPNGRSQDEQGGYALHIAAAAGSYDACNLLLRGGANVNLTSEAMNENTALHLAAYYGHGKVCELLIEGGADKESLNSAGKTPKDMTANLDGPEALKVLQVLHNIQVE